MNSKDLNGKKEFLYNIISKGQFHDAFAYLKAVSESLLTWETTDKLKLAEENYLRMLDYAVDGVDDPSRETFLDNLADELLSLYNLMVVKKKYNENVYEVFMDRLRLSLNSQETIESLINDIMQLKTPADESEFNRNLSREIDLFYRIWTTVAFSQSDLRSIYKSYIAEDSSSSLRNLILAGLLLNSLSVGFSASVAETLLQLYQDSSIPEWKIKSLVVTLLLIISYKQQSDRPKVREMIKKIELSDSATWEQDLRTVLIEFLRTLETELIQKKMNDEIVPAIMKYGPQMKERLNEMDEEDLLSLEENPEWQEIIEKTGLDKHIRELNRLQGEGADVMMFSFGNLKKFPFFNEVHNWFIPFDLRYLPVAELVKNTPQLADLSSFSRFLCDSDMYSFMLTFSVIPQQQRNQQFNVMHDQIQMLNENTVADAPDNKQIANRYIRNLFRFFRLFNRKEEFSDPFSLMKGIADISLLKDFFSKKENLEILAECFFKFKQWEEAAQLYEKLENIGDVSAQLYQKIGYCFQKNGNFDEALDYYLRAELLDENNIWTLRKIATCAGILGRWEMAARYYNKVSESEPENLKITLALARCLFESGDYKRALKEYFKAYYLSPDSPKILQGLCSTLLRLSQIDDAGKYIDKLVEQEPSAEAFMMSGHLKVLHNDFNGALKDYIESLRLFVGEKKSFFKELDDTVEYLRLDDKAKDRFGFMIEKLKYLAIK